MLTIPLEKLAYIIAEAREFDVEVPPVDEDSGSNASDDAEWDVLEASDENPAYPRREGDGLPDRHAAARRLSGRRTLSQLGYSIQDFEIGCI
jgi:hypothetical protein